MGNVCAIFFLLLLLPLVSPSGPSGLLFHEARPPYPSTTKENATTAVRKISGGGRGGSGGDGSGARGGSNGARGGGRNGDSSSPYGKAIPLIAAGAVPKTTGSSSSHKHSSAHSGHNFSIAAFLIITAFWFDSLAFLCGFSYYKET